MVEGNYAFVESISLYSFLTSNETASKNVFLFCVAIYTISHTYSFHEFSPKTLISVYHINDK